MKTKVLFASLLMLLGYCIASFNRNERRELKLEIYFSETARYVSIDNAIDSVKAFVNEHPDMARAFTIGSKDMLQVMGLDTSTTCGFDSCRAYLGLGKNQNFKLYLTPVKNGKDQFFSHFGGTKSNPDRNCYVLDLIAPCPKTCDTESPLYTFKLP